MAALGPASWIADCMVMVVDAAPPPPPPPLPEPTQEDNSGTLLRLAAPIRNRRRDNGDTDMSTSSAPSLARSDRSLGEDLVALLLEGHVGPHRVLGSRVRADDRAPRPDLPGVPHRVPADLRPGRALLERAVRPGPRTSPPARSAHTRRSPTG